MDNQLPATCDAIRRALNERGLSAAEIENVVMVAPFSDGDLDVTLAFDLALTFGSGIRVTAMSNQLLQASHRSAALVTANAWNLACPIPTAAVQSDWNDPTGTASVRFDAWLPIGAAPDDFVIGATIDRMLLAVSHFFRSVIVDDEVVVP